MLSKRSHRISTSTLNFVTRFIWNDHKPSKRPENEALADALNLLTKPTTQSTYKPSLFKSLTEGSVDEQLSKAPPKVHIKHEPHISEHFVNNLLWGIKSSLLDSQINHSQLLNDMSAEELSSYTKRVKNMASLREIVQLFYNHDRLTPRILTDVLLNKSLKSLDNFPIDLNKFEGIKGVDNRAVLHLKIIMLKKYYDLNQPLDIIRNLKSNFAASYLPLIESHQLTPFYERIVWRFVFEYLRQYNEEYYIKSLKSLQSSFLIWESSSYTANQSIAQLILENHGELTKLQVLFLKIASSARTFDVPKLRKISIKYKLHKLKQQEDRKLLYAVLNELENLLIASQPNNTKSLLEELALYRLELVQDVYNRPVEPLESLEWSKA
ncbi:hypothetical protein CANMA_002127 [Candida margitis]|uniref:uncharacterized protein n=1 Tax=Candida margitis TaxID=1775924 RepID=UPI00222807D4|nr:uncharacterized protein CANMA_002127 [Candida margitis]KAI5968691.1 hypothetical protein CANMA_002127 [Candida margitis]